MMQLRAGGHRRIRRVEGTPLLDSWSTPRGVLQLPRMGMRVAAVLFSAIQGAQALNNGLGRRPGPSITHGLLDWILYEVWCVQQGTL